MATERKLGGVFTTDVDNRLSTANPYVSTENVCGLIFDTKGLGTTQAPVIAADSKFANGNIVELNDAKDIEAAGITDTLMGGLPKYHLDTFFTLAGDGQRIFVSFVDSTAETALNDAIDRMQLASGGIIYQIGVWTPVAIATVSGENYTIAANNILVKLQKAAENLGGKIGETNYDGNAPVNILVNAPIVAAATCDYTKLPDLLTSATDCPKVSVILGQASTDEVHAIQLAVNNLGGETKPFVAVGNLGAALGCLAVAPAQESIAHVANFNLAPVMSDAELGFGNLTITDGDWASNAAFTPIKTIKYAARNASIHQRGYIFLRNHDGLEGAVFFSSDQTLSNGDYRTISRGRVIHKSRRVVRAALLPYVNAPLEVESGTGTLTSSDITLFRNLVTDAIDNYMVEPANQTVPQISGREVIIDEEQNVLENDQLLIEYYLLPIGCTSAIYVTEGFTSEIS